MFDPSDNGPKTMPEFIKANPHATDDEIREFASEHNFSVSFSGPSEWDPNEPGFDKFTYTTEDLKDMGAPWLQDGGEATEENKNAHCQDGH